MNIMEEPTFILRTLYNFDLELNLNSFISIMDIKKYIFETRGIPIGKQCMVLGRQILKSSQTLEQCNIVDGTIINFAYPKFYDNNLNH
jgi:hypothetical protein